MKKLRMFFHSLGFHKYKTVGRFTHSGMADGKWIYQRRCELCGRSYQTEFNGTKAL